MCFFFVVIDRDDRSFQLWFFQDFLILHLFCFTPLQENIFSNKITPTSGGRGETAESTVAVNVSKNSPLAATGVRADCRSRFSSFVNQYRTQKISSVHTVRGPDFIRGIVTSQKSPTDFEWGALQNRAGCDMIISPIFQAASLPLLSP